MERVDAASQTNAIRLVNREGENGWNFATAGQGGEDGHLVYAPAWSSDNGVVAYHRFVGYRALVDLNYIEMGGSFQGNGDLLYSGAGWLMPPEFAPRSRRMAVVEYNFSDARGWGGYTQWTIRVLQPGQTSEITLPTGTRETDAALVDQLRYGTAAVWAPAGDELLVTLPAGWSADAPTDQPVFQSRTAGELWRWTPGSEPSERLVQQIDFASPLLWLPPL
jgi:predicted secreted protein